MSHSPMDPPALSPDNPEEPSLTRQPPDPVPDPGGELTVEETQRLLEALQGWGRQRRSGKASLSPPPGRQPQGPRSVSGTATGLGREDASLRRSMGSRDVGRYRLRGAGPPLGSGGDAGSTADTEDQEPLGLLSERDWDAAMRRIRGESLLRGSQTAAQAVHPRRNERLDRQIECLMRVHGDTSRGHSVFRVLSRNISHGGLSLLHGRELSAGADVTLALESDSGVGQILPGVVRWCRRVGRVGPNAAAVFEAGVALAGRPRLTR